jgi:M6 family metalloprotease-like protein
LKVQLRLADERHDRAVQSRKGLSVSSRQRGIKLTSQTGSLPSFVLILAAASALLAVVTPRASGQPAPPHPGVQLPPGYYERIATDRDAFHFKHAWIAQTKRIQENRRLMEMGLLNGITAEAAGGFRVEGTRYVPVLAGKFSNTGADPFSPAQLQQQLFDGPNPTGTITQYYDQISRGYLTLTGTVYGAQGGGLFQVSQPDTYYEGPAGCNGFCGSAHTGEYLKELLDGADPWVDFSRFDNDGPDGVPNSGDDDGYVDVVAFVQPESGGDCGNDNIWSYHWTYDAWWGAPYTTDDPSANGGYIRVSDYTIQPLLSCDDSSLIEIGVFAHELGHAFGLPDLYDIDYSSRGIGIWGLMGAGSWGGDMYHPQTPTHMCAWSKEQLGWVDPVPVYGDPTEFSLPAVETSGEVLKAFPHGIPGNEYFLIENRVQTGFDSDLPTSGIAIWHVDSAVTGNQNDTHRLVDLEEADGLDQLDAYTSFGDAGDLFPGAASAPAFDDTTYPDAHTYAGNPTGLGVSNFGTAANPRTLEVGVDPGSVPIGDVAIHDTAEGNGNGTLDANERVELSIGLRRGPLPPLSGLVATLTSLDSAAVVHQAMVSYGSLSGGDTLNYGCGDFEIEVTRPVADGTAVQFRLDLSADGGFAISPRFTIPVGDHVLVVEDDGGAGHDSLYRDAVLAAGRAVALRSTADGVPWLGALRAARAVVWYTGREAGDTFTSEEQALVESYLDGGGSLLVTGQDIGHDLVARGSTADQTFYRNYLHADFISDSSGNPVDNTVNGVISDPVSDGVYLNLVGGDGADNSTSPSVISPRTGATFIFRYSPGVFGAVRWSTGHRLVYLAFNFEAINSASVRDTLMRRALDWLRPGDTNLAVSLATPDGGETFGTGNEVAVTWTALADAGVDHMNLHYSSNDGATWSLAAAGLENTPPFAWSAPDVPSTLYRIRVTAFDSLGNSAADTSAATFTVVDDDPPVVVLTAPDGGEELTGGSTAQISASVSDNVGVDSVCVAYTRDDGATWVGITCGTVGFPYAWSVPDSAGDSCRVRITAWDTAGNPGSAVSDSTFSILGGTTAVGPGPGGAGLPLLLRTWPNPMRSSAAVLAFHLPDRTPVSLRIYDLSGRLVKTVAERTFAAGYYKMTWDGTADGGTRVGQGIYFAVLRTPERHQVRKLVKLR